MPQIDNREIDYLLSVGEAATSARSSVATMIVHSFSGVRPLYDDNAENSVGGDPRLYL